MPVFYVLIIRIFVPIFAAIILVISIVNEFGDTDSRTSSGWNQGHIWGGRLIWLIPLILMGIAAAFPLKNQEHFDELLAKQYGIRFDDSKITFLQKLYKNKCEFVIIDHGVYDTI